MVKKLMTIASALVLAVGVAVPCLAAEGAGSLPEMSIPMLSGKTVTTADIVKSPAAVITFIQTACSSCKAEIIELNKLAKASKANVMVLPIAVDMRTGKEFLNQYKSENAVDLDFGFDPKFAIPIKFGFSFTPATVVIKDGKVVKTYNGYDDTIKGELAQLFK